MVSDADGEATLWENWSLVKVLARSIRSIIEFSSSRASSSFRTEKRASSSVTRLLMSCREVRSSKNEYLNLSIVKKSLFGMSFFEKN